MNDDPIQRLRDAAQAVSKYLKTEAEMRAPKVVHAVMIIETQAQCFRRCADDAEAKDSAIVEFKSALAAMPATPWGRGEAMTITDEQVRCPHKAEMYANDCVDCLRSALASVQREPVRVKLPKIYSMGHYPVLIYDEVVERLKAAGVEIAP